MDSGPVLGYGTCFRGNDGGRGQGAHKGCLYSGGGFRLAGGWSDAAQAGELRRPLPPCANVFRTETVAELRGRFRRPCVPTSGCRVRVRV